MSETGDRPTFMLSTHFPGESFHDSYFNVLLCYVCKKKKNSTAYQRRVTLNGCGGVMKIRSISLLPNGAQISVIQCSVNLALHHDEARV